MTVIGLTGPSGAGKTELCKIAKQLGCECINADEVYHSLLIPPSRCLDEIVENFGRDILLSDNSLNRAELGRIVFSSKEKLALLNTITHKYVKDEFRSIINEIATVNTMASTY